MSCTDDITVAFYRLYTIKAFKVDIKLHPAPRAKPTCQWHVDTLPEGGELLSSLRATFLTEEG